MPDRVAAVVETAEGHRSKSTTSVTLKKQSVSTDVHRKSADVTHNKTERRYSTTSGSSVTSSSSSDGERSDGECSSSSSSSSDGSTTSGSTKTGNSSSSSSSSSSACSHISKSSKKSTHGPSSPSLYTVDNCSGGSSSEREEFDVDLAEPDVEMSIPETQTATSRLTVVIPSNRQVVIGQRNVVRVTLCRNDVTVPDSGCQLHSTDCIAESKTTSVPDVKKLPMSILRIPIPTLVPAAVTTANINHEEEMWNSLTVMTSTAAEPEIEPVTPSAATTVQASVNNGSDPANVTSETSMTKNNCVVTGSSCRQAISLVLKKKPQSLGRPVGSDDKSATSNALSSVFTSPLQSLQLYSDDGEEEEDATGRHVTDENVEELERTSEEEDAGAVAAAAGYTRDLPRRIHRKQQLPTKSKRPEVQDERIPTTIAKTNSKSLAEAADGLKSTCEVNGIGIQSLMPQTNEHNHKSPVDTCEQRQKTPPPQTGSRRQDDDDTDRRRMSSRQQSPSTDRKRSRSSSRRSRRSRSRSSRGGEKRRTSRDDRRSEERRHRDDDCSRNRRRRSRSSSKRRQRSPEQTSNKRGRGRSDDQLTADSRERHVAGKPENRLYSPADNQRHRYRNRSGSMSRTAEQQEVQTADRCCSFELTRLQKPDRSPGETADRRRLSSRSRTDASKLMTSPKDVDVTSRRHGDDETLAADCSVRQINRSADDPASGMSYPSAGCSSSRSRTAALEHSRSETVDDENSWRRRCVELTADSGDRRDRTSTAGRESRDSRSYQRTTEQRVTVDRTRSRSTSRSRRLVKRKSSPEQNAVHDSPTSSVRCAASGRHVTSGSSRATERVSPSTKDAPRRRQNGEQSDDKVEDGRRRDTKYLSRNTYSSHSTTDSTSSRRNGVHRRPTAPYPVPPHPPPPPPHLRGLLQVPPGPGVDWSTCHRRSAAGQPIHAAAGAARLASISTPGRHDRQTRTVCNGSGNSVEMAVIRQDLREVSPSKLFVVVGDLLEDPETAPVNVKAANSQYIRQSEEWFEALEASRWILFTDMKIT